MKVFAFLILLVTPSAFASPELCSDVFHSSSESHLHLALKENLLAEELLTKNRKQEAAWVLRDNNQRKAAKFLEDQISQELKTGEIVEAQVLGGNTLTTGESLILIFKSGLRGIFKPDVIHWKRDPDPAIKDIPMSAAEIAAYEFARELEVNVPVTVKRNFQGKSGSLQVWVKQDPTTTSIGEFFKVLTFDYLINNRDRNPGNFLTAVEKTIAIDHGLAFQPPKFAIGVHTPKPLRALIIDTEVSGFYMNLKTRLTPLRIRELLQKDFPEEVIHETIFRRTELLKKYGEWLENSGRNPPTIPL